MKAYLLISIVIFSSNLLLAQEQLDVLKLKTRYGFEVDRRPAVNFNIFCNYSQPAWTPRLYLAVNIQNDRLQFTKQAENYLAEYQIGIAIRKDKNTVYQENWFERVLLDNFDVTNAKDIYQYKLFVINHFDSDGENLIMAGDYECFFEIRDFTSNNIYKGSRKFKVSEYDQNSIAHSEITFLVPNENSQFPLWPASEALIFTKPYTAFSRITAAGVDSVRVNARIYRLTEDEDKLYIQDFFSVGVDSLTAAIRYNLPSDSLGEGRYRLRFSGQILDQKFDLEKKFSIHWFDKPTYLYKADLAIRPMQYLLSKEEYKDVSGLSYNQLEAWFNDYWKKRDPTPETNYNELLDVFYQRVQVANERFSLRYKEGWETDRGKILLLYGEPDKIENRRYVTNQKPYLVWKYEKQELTFIFIDQKRDGDFVLLTEDIKE